MSHLSRSSFLSVGTVALLLAIPARGSAQILKKVTDAASSAAEDEALTQVDRLARSVVTCMFYDLECIEGAMDSGEEFVLTDEQGEIVFDEEGNPVSDPGVAAEILGEEAPPDEGSALDAAGAPGVPPGEGAITNFDFVPGERAIVEVDYDGDNLGDFPREFELIRGSFDVIEWQGVRYVRAISGGSFAIALPETLPEKFTIETSVSVQHGNAYVRITPGRAFNAEPRTYKGSAISVQYGTSGVLAVGAGPDAMAPHDYTIVAEAVATLQVMADREHMKVYLDGQRVANVPNAIFPRSDTLFIAVSSAYREKPILIGPIRVAAGDIDLYDRLAREGRVTTRGILFDVDSDAIRIESAATLEQIGTMLVEHPDLRISIEGHTDADGDAAYNLELSRRRAEAVRTYLLDTYAIDAARLESQGFGESEPVAPNDTAEGKKQNRRVELVML